MLGNNHIEYNNMSVLFVDGVIVLQSHKLCIIIFNVINTFKKYNMAMGISTLKTIM